MRQSESCTPAPGGKQQLGPGTERSIVSPAAQLLVVKMMVVVACGKHEKERVCAQNVSSLSWEEHV